MKKRILMYRIRIDQCLAGECEVTDWEELRKEHLIQIGFFQHERLVHLLVTLTFALLTVGTVLTFILTQYLPLVLLGGAFLILLVPYIMHYYLLENETQKLYVQYDEIRKRASEV